MTLTHKYNYVFAFSILTLIYSTGFANPNSSQNLLNHGGSGCPQDLSPTVNIDKDNTYTIEYNSFSVNRTNSSKLKESRAFCLTTLKPAQKTNEKLALTSLEIIFDNDFAQKDSLEASLSISKAGTLEKISLDKTFNSKGSETKWVVDLNSKNKNCFLSNKDALEYKLTLKHPRSNTKSSSKAIKATLKFSKDSKCGNTK